MSLSIVCSQCAKTLRASDEMAGKRARCPHCKTVVAIPAPAPEPVLEPVDDETYGVSQESLPVRPTFVPPPVVARSAEEAYEQAIRKTLLEKQRPKERRSGIENAGNGAVVGPRKNAWLPYLFALTLVPLVFSLLPHTDDIGQRLARTLEAHPDAITKIDGDRDAFLAALPERRIDGAHLSSESWAHWLYALLAAAFFCGLIHWLFERGEAQITYLLAIGLLTATVGIFMLIAFQWVAGITQGFWVRGRGIIVILFYIVKFIGFSYQAALDPENGFMLSFLGFTCGVGLCEEFTKALPLYIRVGNGEDFSWRAACVVGLASGVGFGIAEGIMYASQHYNGISTFGIYPVRFISCVGLHAIWTASVAIMLWHNQELAGGELDWGDWILGLLKVQGVPMVLHGLYDTLLKRDMHLLALVTAAASFAWLAFLIARSRAADPEPQSIAPALA